MLMLCSGQRDSVWVGGCFFGYQLTLVDLDEEPLDGLLLFHIGVSLFST